MKGLLEVQRYFALGNRQQRCGKSAASGKGIVFAQRLLKRGCVQAGNDLRYAVCQSFGPCRTGWTKQKQQYYSDKERICSSSVRMTGSASAMSITRPARSTFMASPSSPASRQVCAAKSINRLIPPIFSSCVM